MLGSIREFFRFGDVNVTAEELSQHFEGAFVEMQAVCAFVGDTRKYFGRVENGNVKLRGNTLGFGPVGRNSNVPLQNVDRRRSHENDLRANRTAAVNQFSEISGIVDKA